MPITMVNSDMYWLREEQARARRAYEAQRVLVRAPKAPDRAAEIFRAIGQFGGVRADRASRVSA